MKNKNIFGLTIFFLVLTTYSLKAQITVNSLLELKPYMSQDNVNIKLAPGDYYLNADDITNGDWGEDIPHFTWAKGVMVFSGSNSIYDFTGVTIYFNTNIYTAFGSFDIWTLQIQGNDNTLKNLTMVDDGSVYDAPTDGATNVTMDGKNNVIDGFHVTGKGSSPYGWGDSFGKGSGSILALQKHSNFLIRGDYNTVKNTTIIHRAFGHCIFMQAANTPTIDGCYVEGEMRSTDDMLADPGILDPPTTTWGYRLPSGYTKALCEEGIRSYNRGSTLIDGVFVERGTNDITVKNTTVKNTRGFSLVLSGGFRHVENITLIGNEFGFSVGDAELINCKADCTYGPAYMNAYDDKRNTITGDLTILPPSGPYHNGSGIAAFFGGSNSNINIHSTDGSIGNGLVIKVGGVTDNVGQIGNDPHTASGNTINNNTNYPVIIESGSSNNTITSCAVVTDNGTNNTVSNGTSCSTEICYTYPDLEETPAGLVSGLKYYYFEGTWTELPNFNVTTPVNSGTSNGLDLSLAEVDDNYGFRFFGYINVTEDAEYTFYTTSNDESKLLIDGALVVHNTGSGLSEDSGSVCLDAGLHEFRLDFYEAVGNENLSVKYESSTISKQDVSELYYVSSPENLALNGVATQSITTNTYGGPPELAIDGNTNGSYSGGSVTHTDHGSNGSGELKWWQVDLQADKVITKINIYNRTDSCCKDRLNNFTVKVLDSNGVETFSQFYEDYPNPLKVIELENITGQIVRIEKTSDYGLTLAEVQVFGLSTSSLSVDEPNLQTINAYPNPVKDILNLSLVKAGFNLKSANISIYNLNGQKVINTKADMTETQLDLSQLKSGIYILMVEDEVKTLTKKIVKL